MDEPRIGNRERELAMGALDEHLRAGRLGTTEHAERSATASTARLRSELDALFTDLPAPHPDYPPDRHPADHAGPDRHPPGGSASDRGPGAGPGAAAPTDRHDDLPELVVPAGAALARHAGKLSVLAPLIAFGLFAITGFRFPVIFLLVPVAIAALGWLGHRHGG